MRPLAAAIIRLERALHYFTVYGVPFVLNGKLSWYRRPCETVNGRNSLCLNSHAIGWFLAVNYPFLHILAFVIAWPEYGVLQSPAWILGGSPFPSQISTTVEKIVEILGVFASLGGEPPGFAMIWARWPGLSPWHCLYPARKSITDAVTSDAR